MKIIRTGIRFLFMNILSNKVISSKTGYNKTFRVS